MEKSKSKSKAVIFACNWCSYAGADTAGIGRMEQPTLARVIRFMCSGRVDPLFVLLAFLEGADCVFVTGCHPGDCHYISGNYKTKRRFEFLEEFFAELGLEKERLRLEWISASEGEKWTSLMKDAEEVTKKLGPSRLK
jgi:F420-non-reducing hydrogenase iron-sulfur subunit